jgi:hypothetical protein
MFNKDSFIHYHAANSRTGFTPSNAVYEGFVQDAEGKPWGWLKSLNLYEQQSTGIRMDPAEFQRYNIDILGYGSNDGDSGATNTPTVAVPTDWNDPTWVDGIFEFTSGDVSLGTSSRIFTIVENSTEYTVDTKLVVQLSSTTVINLQEGQFILASFNDAPYIGLYLDGPVGVKGWYIAESDAGGNYNYLRGSKGNSFPDPISQTLNQPFAITFYAEDPGDPAAWSDYTTP